MNSSKTKILSVLGTRPEAIKMAPVIHELRKYPEDFHSVVCVTGQHRHMLDQVLELFDIQPDYDLDVMEPNQQLSKLTAGMLSGLSPLITEIEPDWILAQGDTTTVLAAALCAFYHKIKFGHVEAGLRTGDINNPYPEEMNRRIADNLSAVLFAPTEKSRLSLLFEGFPDERITVTGNTVIDALLKVADYPYNWSTGPMANLPREKSLVLVTAHRRESFGRPLHEMCLAVRDLALRFESEGVHFIYPVHLNPHVRETAGQVLSEITNVSLIEPLDYLSLVHLMKRSILILTDSGGIQEEAPSLGVPVLVMRETTERPEGVEAGVVKLVGTDRNRIVQETEYLLLNKAERTVMSRRVNPYGDGNAASRVVSALFENSPVEANPEKMAALTG